MRTQDIDGLYIGTFMELFILGHIRHKKIDKHCIQNQLTISVTSNFKGKFYNAVFFFICFLFTVWEDCSCPDKFPKG